MRDSRNEYQILIGLETGEKTYSFKKEHDKTKPSLVWFQESCEGLILFIVFYTQACRWTRCLGCNLPSLGSFHHIDYKALVAQIDYIFSRPEIMGRREEIRKIIISNNGSVLDEETFSSTALMYLMVKVNLNFPNLAVLTIETRPQYVQPEELEFLSRALKEGDTPTELEFAIGFEAFNDEIRNKVYRKGLSLKAFEKFLREITKYGFRLKCYFMQKPVPGMTDQQAIEDIRKAIGYLSKMAETYGIKISLHLNPTYVASGTILEKSFKKGEYFPPRLIDVARSVLFAEGKNVPVFIGLSDEGLSCPGGSAIRENDEIIVSKLEEFNRTQDFNILRSLVASAQ